jgi:hypothetical protein
VTADAGRLLGAVAAALNALERAGVAVDLNHGAVLTTYGYVLPAGDARLGSRWAVRTRIEPEMCREITEGGQRGLDGVTAGGI